METCNSTAVTDATAIRGATSNDGMLHLNGVYQFECYGEDGNLRWKDTAVNLIPDQGKNGMLDSYFAGSAYSAAWLMSLITAGSATSTSTYASPTVTEITTGILIGDTRAAMTWGTTASAGAKTATLTALSIVGSATITGSMVVTGGTGVTAVGNTAASGGILFSAANFGGGSKLVGNGDTLNVTYSVSL